MGFLKHSHIALAAASNRLFPAGPNGFTQIRPDGLSRTDIYSQNEPASAT